MKKIICAIALFFGFLLLALYAPERLGCCPEINTIYTKEFTYQKFYSITKGMNKEEVQKILGEPFFVWKPGYECWSYSKGKDGTLGDFIGWAQVQVCFKGDKVEDTPRSVFYN